ncbi:hypothetical protein [Pseudomonas eucalypticola]|uniref:Uncharacterized protein n=1 Tax=Pseudomonas eucalypticola TaxID=2599595 RepID=A0A7D5D9K2_9PSED|nr:hypothetical protein [Pseudomonas eucalypticola]QKZ06172.1 hypothetical protein HWQ56_21290 [Pseudomonas eucalypticola]
MPFEREAVLEQALIAMLGAAKDMGVETDVLVSNAMNGLLANASYRWIKESALNSVINEMALAHFAQAARPDQVRAERERLSRMES